MDAGNLVDVGMGFNLCPRDVEWRSVLETYFVSDWTWCILNSMLFAEFHV